VLPAGDLAQANALDQFAALLLPGMRDIETARADPGRRPGPLLAGVSRTP
jgi:hypothetical protein